MRNLFDPQDVKEILDRIDNLTPAAQRQWGKMNVSQMVAHCNISMETAMGKHKIPRLFAGRIIGTLLKKKVLNEKPFSKNSPTDKSFVFPDAVNFEEHKGKLKSSVQQFFDGGPAKCTTHPHPFFGHYMPQQWAILQWKHTDHHLRQFGV